MPFFAPEKLVLPILISDLELRHSVDKTLISTFGPMDTISRLLPFEYTHYYDREMGVPIRRYFMSAERVVDPSDLSNIKQLTSEIEDRFRVDGKRRINIDPGLLSLSRFILASTKDSSHRIPLQNGIFAEITLQYERGAFRETPWTYPDYAGETYRQILKNIRSLYKQQLDRLQETALPGS